MELWFRLPRPGVEPVLDRTCPSCGHLKMHVHQHQRERRIVDYRLDTIHQVRVKCPRCGKTATCRPEGVQPNLHRTPAVVAYGVVLYVLGLSYRNAAGAVKLLVGQGSKSAVERDVRAAGQQAQRMHTARAGRPVRILGIDGTGQRIKRRGTTRHVGVGFAVDAEQGVLLGVELMEEEKPNEVRRFVRRLCRRYDVEVILTDEHSSYPRAMRSRNVTAQHRLCQTHWKKSKQLRVRSLRAQAQERGHRRMVRDLDRLKRLIRDGPPDALQQLLRIHRRYLDAPPPRPGQPWSLRTHLRMLTHHLIETWERVGTDTQPTNNTAERLIGLLLKERSKTMRGFASADSIPRFVHLAAYLREQPRGPVLDLTR